MELTTNLEIEVWFIISTDSFAIYIHMSEEAKNGNSSSKNWKNIVRTSYERYVPSHCDKSYESL